MPAPLLFEVNTRSWLADLSRQAGKPLTLAEVPDSEITRWKNLGITHIWLMGIWNVGPLARELALQHGQQHWPNEIPSNEEDVWGSPYAISEYSVHPKLGQPLDLLLLRDRLRAAGLRMILDFVPNHLGIDSAEALTFPSRFVQSATKVPGTVGLKTKFGKRFFAHGRDPYFPPWEDTLQLDYRNPDTHETMATVAQTLVMYGDGLRCDMAMLVLPEIFQETWKEFPPTTLKVTAKNFWQLAISRMRQMNPGALLIAEAYWGREQELQNAGFDYTYNKKLLDLLVGGKIPQLREYLLNSPLNFLKRSVHFLENHDEPRVSATLPLKRHKLAALLMLALPGMPLLHDGQIEGRRSFARIQVAPRKEESPDLEIQRFYEGLLQILAKTSLRQGEAQVIPVQPIATDQAVSDDVISIAWRSSEGATDLVVLNFGEAPAQFIVPCEGRVTLEKLYCTETDSGEPLPGADSQLLLELPAESGKILRLHPA